MKGQKAYFRKNFLNPRQWGKQNAWADVESLSSHGTQTEV